MNMTTTIQSEQSVPKLRVYYEDDFVIGIPAGWLTHTEFHAYLTEWLNQSPVKPDVIYKISNRVDLNRSELITEAKKRNKHLIMIDTDIFPMIPYIIVRDYLLQDFSVCGAVIAPVKSVVNTEMYTVAPGEDPNKQVIEVIGGSTGFAAFRKDVLQRLKPIGYYNTVGSSKPSEMYTVYTLDKSEDYALLMRIRDELGEKVCLDRRIMIMHKKYVMY